MDRNACSTNNRSSIYLTATSLLIVLLGSVPLPAHAQAADPKQSTGSEIEQLRSTVTDLAAEVANLRRELDGLKGKTENPRQAPSITAPPSTNPALPTTVDAPKDLWSGTTFNVAVDGYYAYNFNKPVGRVNLLRAYDVSSNSFSLNQANLIIERAPDVATGRRFGARLDLQYGQATETLQGSAANESRPQVYRPVFQVYGTYVAPVAQGLTIDFGKFASAMGYEGNYTKDQFNYSRAYFFNFLPFYHMGFRNTLAVNDKVSVGYWLINGVQQTEDFNGFKSHVFQLVVKPAKTLQWSAIYHVGREQRDTIPGLNPTLPTLPSQPGLSISKISPTPDGRFHLLDSYVTWSATPKLTLVGEADYVVNRAFEHSAPAHVTGGAAYAHYQFDGKNALSLRAEYLSDRGGLFSGVTQALKETTATYEYKFAEGFLTRLEWRRDFSNKPFFLTDVPNVLKKEQNTATVGLIWWFGQKQGSW